LSWLDREVDINLSSSHWMKFSMLWTKNGQRAVRSVLEMLAERVKKVFVVSHASLETGPVSGIIHFEMPRGSNGNPLGTKVNIKSSY